MKKLNQTHTDLNLTIFMISHKLLFLAENVKTHSPKEKALLCLPRSQVQRRSVLFFRWELSPSSLEEKWPSGRCLSTFQLLRA